MFLTKRKIGLAAVLVFILAAIYLLHPKKDSELPTDRSEEPVAVSAAVQESSGQEDSTQKAREKLVRGGWTVEAADAVIKINSQYFNGMAQFGEEALDDALTVFLRLGKNHVVQKELAEYPEIASLCGSALQVREDAPLLILQTLPKDEEERNIVYSLYQQNAVPEEACRIAEILQDNGVRDRVIRLLKKSPVSLKYIDHFDFAEKLLKEDRAAGEVYRTWLFGVIDEILRCGDTDSNSDELSDVDRLDLTLEIHAESIRNNLRDAGFRDQFLSIFWPEFQRLFSTLDRSDPDYELKWSAYLCDPNLWTMLRYYGKDTVGLYRDYGEHAPAILLSPKFLDPGQQEAQEAILRFMRSANAEEMRALVMANLPENQQYANFLCRTKERRIIRESLTQLALAENGNGSKSPDELLRYWRSLDDEALKREFPVEGGSIVEAFPGYDVWQLGRKWIDGRDVSGMDCFLAALDGAFIVLDVATLGTSTVVASSTSATAKGSKAIGKSLLKQTGTQTVKVTAKTTSKYAFHEGMSTATEVALKQGGKKTALSVLQKTRRFFMQACSKLKNAGQIDLTDLARYAFSKSRIGLKSFKRWTQLDARCFMRADRRVVMDLGVLPTTRAGQLLGNITRDTAIGAGFLAAASSDTGQTIIRSTIQTAKEAWQTNLSSWWLLNSGDLIR